MKTYSVVRVGAQFAVLETEDGQAKYCEAVLGERFGDSEEAEFECKVRRARAWYDADCAEEEARCNRIEAEAEARWLGRNQCQEAEWPAEAVAAAKVAWDKRIQEARGDA